MIRISTGAAAAALVAVAALAAGCAETSGSANETAFTRIASEQAFREAVEGRRLDYGRGSYTTFGMDGTLGGMIGGQAAQGRWEWKDDLYCREATWGSSGVDYACVPVEISGNRLRVYRPDGSYVEGTLES